MPADDSQLPRDLPRSVTANDSAILSSRGVKNCVDTHRPYQMLVEPEYCADGTLADVATIFLTNKECPFRCLMCDLWKNTTDDRVPAEAIPDQIRFALSALPPANHVKLYNSGNFFDAQAIPTDDIPKIAELVSGFQTVIVENHPKLCNDRVVEFQQLCGTQLEVAVGLETSHEPTLRRLNKQMTTANFAAACNFLRRHNIRIRTFILLRPPWTTEEEGIKRAIDSIQYAFDCGVNCCSIIPTRPGNGIMDILQKNGDFCPPKLASLDAVIDETIRWKRGRVFADVWDIERFSDCDTCINDRVERLQRINLTQNEAPPVVCPRCFN